MSQVVIKIRKTKTPSMLDPQTYLLFRILDQAFDDIRSFYFHKGTRRDQLNGKIALRWIQNQEGTFPLIAQAAENTLYDIHIENLHMWCIKKIHELDIIKLKFDN